MRVNVSAPEKLKKVARIREAEVSALTDELLKIFKNYSPEEAAQWVEVNVTDDLTGTKRVLKSFAKIIVVLLKRAQ